MVWCYSSINIRPTSRLRSAGVPFLGLPALLLAQTGDLLISFQNHFKSAEISHEMEPWDCGHGAAGRSNEAEQSRKHEGRTQ